MLVSFAYVLVRRLFELILLLARGDRSKGAGDRRSAARAVDPAPSARTAAARAARPAAAGDVEPRAAAALVVMQLDDERRTPKFLIHDRDSKFSRAFDGVFDSEGVTIIRAPVRAPNAYAYAERWSAASAASASTGC